MAGKILYVCQEIFPYLPESEQSALCRQLVQAMQERGNEIRTFMPRYGVINERRNQLHEVIRLSGMNLIIDDNDHQLIIKVASIPSARVQIYFIDNDDYFARKAVLRDPATDGMFPDNDERYLGADSVELLKKVRDVLQEHGWKPGNLDATVIAQRPKLAPYIQQMREILAQAMGTELDRVSVKATTEEKLGFTGEGLGIAAHAVALIE